MLLTSACKLCLCHLKNVHTVLVIDDSKVVNSLSIMLVWKLDMLCVYMLSLTMWDHISLLL